MFPALALDVSNKEEEDLRVKTNTHSRLPMDGQECQNKIASHRALSSLLRCGVHVCVFVCVCACLQACSIGVLLVHRVRESQTWGRVWDKISRVWEAMAALREAGDNRYGFWPVGQHHSRSRSLIPRHRVPLVVFLGIFICSLSPSPTSIFRNRLMFH